jgi:hypothetical protein
MKATIGVLATVLVASVMVSVASANPYQPVNPPPTAPDMSGPGLYYPNYCGTYSGPYYWVQPPWQPYQGPVGSSPCLGQQLGFPTHPYARGPRDYFMVGN